MKKEINNKSMLEIALELMKKKKVAKSLTELAKEVFEQKGFTADQGAKAMGQFQIDFMLSGYFVCCGEDAETKEKLWDLKCRQPFSLIDKDGNMLDDPYENDPEATKYELNDTDIDKDPEEEDDIDDEEEKEEKDEVEELLEEKNDYDLVDEEELDEYVKEEE